MASPMLPRSETAIDVSVVVPVLNGRAFVCEAIDSVFAQQGATVEVIVVDNGSTDGSAELVAERYGERVRLATESKPGAASARNTGAALAVGTWLGFLDADDLWLAGKLQRQLEALRPAAPATLCLSWCEEFYSAELSERQRQSLSIRREAYPMLLPSSLLLRLDCFRRIGPFPEIAAGEFFAWYGWARELGVQDCVVPEVLVRRRVHASNTTRMAGRLQAYPAAAKWLIDRRRKQAMSAGSGDA
jgi:glycosyltransferase involved in cell wall biosynthesis